MFLTSLHGQWRQSEHHPYRDVIVQRSRCDRIRSIVVDQIVLSTEIGR
jgi:hypothetical protein